VTFLHVCGSDLECGGKPSCLPRRGPPGQPGAQLALLAPCERRHLGRIARAALHHRERLEHRVVQVGGNLGALL
jgi:hypothetical protein